MRPADMTESGGCCSGKDKKQQVKLTKPNLNEIDMIVLGD